MINGWVALQMIIQAGLQVRITTKDKMFYIVEFYDTDENQKLWVDGECLDTLLIDAYHKVTK